MKEAILEGLKHALARGESLQSAMQSFYNAGYDVKEIQAAAHDLQGQISQHHIQQSAKKVRKIPKIFHRKNS